MSENLESSIKSTTREVDRINQKLLEEKGMLESLSRVLGRKLKSFQDIADAVDNVNEGLTDWSDSTKKYGDAFAEVVKKQRKEQKKLHDDVEGFQELLGDMPKELSEDFSKSITGIRHEFKRGLENKLIKTMESIGEKLRDNIQLSADDIFTMKDQKTVISRVQAISDEIAKLDDRTIGKGLFAKGIEAKQLGSSIKEGWKDRTGGGMRTAGKYLSEKGAVSTGMKGAAMRGGGAALAGAARLVPIAGGVVTAVSAINNMVNAADELLKGARSDYRAMAGPQFEGQKFADRSKEYNVAIRNSGRNRELGVDHHDWNSMFQTMNNAGMTVTTVQDKLGDLGTVMTSVRKTSLVMGLSLDTTSDIMANQYIEMKSGLDTMQEGLLAVSRGAKVAGLETSRFYQSVQQSTMSMAAYGNFTVAAATSLEKLSVSSGNSQKDAEEGQVGLTTMFKDMSAQDRLAFAGTMVKELGSPEAFIQKYISDNKEKLKTTTNKDERQRLLKNVNAGQEAKNAASSDPLVAMSNLLGQMDPGQNADLLMQLVRKINGGNPDKSITEMLSGVGSLIEFGPAQQKSLELLRGTLVGYQSQLGASLKAKGATEMLNKHSQQLATSGTAEQQSEYAKVLETLRDGGKASDDELEHMSGYLINTLGLTEDALHGFQQILSVDMVSAGNHFTRAFERNKELVGLGKEATAAASESSIAEQMLENYATAGRGAKGLSLTVQGQDEMIRSLTPLEKMTQITKDSVLYQMADNAVARTAVGISMDIRNAVFGIFDKMSEEEAGTAKKDIQRAEKLMNLDKIREDENFNKDMWDAMEGLRAPSTSDGDKDYLDAMMYRTLSKVKAGKLTPAQARDEYFNDKTIQKKLRVKGGIEGEVRNTLEATKKLMAEGKVSNAVNGAVLDITYRLAARDAERQKVPLKDVHVPPASTPVNNGNNPNAKNVTNVYVLMDPSSGQSSASANYKSYVLGQGGR